MWLLKYLTIQKAMDSRVATMLRNAQQDADRRLIAIRGRDNISTRVERARLASVKAEINRVLALLWMQMNDEVGSNQARAAAAALDASFDWDSVLLRVAFPRSDDRANIRNYLEHAVSRNVELAVRRTAGVSFPLSQRVYKAKQLSDGWVDRKIQAVIIRSGNWKELATEVKDSIRPDTPGGVAYAAKRLARTELNNAYHAMSAEFNADKPWVTGFDWNLSKSHPAPDECNSLADASPYPRNRVPGKAHPQCLCYISPALPTPEEFSANYRAGAYDDYMTAHYGRAS